MNEERPCGRMLAGPFYFKEESRMKSENVKIMKYDTESREWKEILDRIEKEAQESIEKVGVDIYVNYKDRDRWSWAMKH